jgi:hypothetical protein
MKRAAVNPALVVLGAVLAGAFPAPAASPIRVMLLDGEQAGAYHA